MLTALSVFAVACSDDAPAASDVNPRLASVATQAPAVGFEPELVTEDIALGGGGTPPLIGVSFTNRTDVDLSLTLSSRIRNNDSANSKNSVLLEADGKGRYAAVLMNPTQDFLFGFQLEHKDWLGLNNVYYFYPGYGSEPGEGCDQKQPDVEGAVYVDENSRIGRMAVRSGVSPKPLWTIEFTEPNAQGYQGKLTLQNGAKADGSKLEFTCYFNMYTTTQINLRRNALSVIWEAYGLYYEYVFGTMLGAGASLVGSITGNDTIKDFGDNLGKKLYKTDYFNTKVYDLAQTASGADSILEKIAANDPSVTGDTVDSGVLVQKLSDTLSIDKYWDRVTEGVSDAQYRW